VFPEPFGPRKPKIVPVGMRIDTSSTACTVPNARESPSVWIAYSAMQYASLDRSLLREHCPAQHSRTAYSKPAGEKRLQRRIDQLCRLEFPFDRNVEPPQAITAVLL